MTLQTDEDLAEALNVLNGQGPLRITVRNTTSPAAAAAEEKAKFQAPPNFHPNIPEVMELIRNGLDHFKLMKHQFKQASREAKEGRHEQPHVRTQEVCSWRPQYSLFQNSQNFLVQANMSPFLYTAKREGLCCRDTGLSQACKKQYGVHFFGTTELLKFSRKLVRCKIHALSLWLWLLVSSVKLCSC